MEKWPILIWISPLNWWNDWNTCFPKGSYPKFLFDRPGSQGKNATSSGYLVKWNKKWRFFVFFPNTTVSSLNSRARIAWLIIKQGHKAKIWDLFHQIVKNVLISMVYGVTSISVALRQQNDHQRFGQCRCSARVPARTPFFQIFIGGKCPRWIWANQNARKNSSTSRTKNRYSLHPQHRERKPQRDFFCYLLNHLL